MKLGQIVTAPGGVDVVGEECFRDAMERHAKGKNDRDTDEQGGHTAELTTNTVELSTAGLVG